MLIIENLSAHMQIKVTKPQEKKDWNLKSKKKSLVQRSKILQYAATGQKTKGGFFSLMYVTDE